MPPRLYYWLALGASATAIGVGFMANHYDWIALIAFLTAFAFVAVGGIAELAIPFINWEYHGFGSCDRAIRKRIKAANELLRCPHVSDEEWLTWQRNTEFVLTAQIGMWNPEFQLFESAGP